MCTRAMARTCAHVPWQGHVHTCHGKDMCTRAMARTCAHVPWQGHVHTCHGKDMCTHVLHMLMCTHVLHMLMCTHVLHMLSAYMHTDCRSESFEVCMRSSNFARLPNCSVLRTCPQCILHMLSACMHSAHAQCSHAQCSHAFCTCTADLGNLAKF